MPRAQAAFLANQSCEVVSALSGVPRTTIPLKTEQGTGRGTFDRGDLKEAAGGAGRAMEPLACVFSFGSSYVVDASRKRMTKPLAGPSKASGRDGAERWRRETMFSKWSSA